MKKTLAPLLILLVIGFGAAAQGLPEAGATPGSAAFSLERMYESTVMMFTSEEDKPAKRALFAEERLSEAKKLASKNRTERAGKALDIYRDHLNKIEDEELVRNTTSRAMATLEEIEQSLPAQKSNGLNKAIKSIKEMSSSSDQAENASENSQGAGFMATGRVVQRN